MLYSLTRFRRLTLLALCLILLTGAQDLPAEKDLLLNSPVWGDFRKAKKVREQGQAPLKVWDHLGEYQSKFYGGAPPMRSGQDRLTVSYDELWVLESHDYLRLGKKRPVRRDQDLVKLYWKGDRVQALTVERPFRLDPLTLQTFPQAESRLMAIFPRDLILKELTRQAQKDKDFDALRPFEHLREAKKALAEGNPDAEALRQRTYGRLEDARRHLEAVTRRDDEYREVRDLLKEVARREKDRKRQRQVMDQEALDLAAKRRQELASELDREFLTKGLDVKMELRGAAKDALTLDCVLFSRPLVFLFLDKSDLLKNLKDAGFREVTFTNKAVRYSWAIDLDGL